MRKIKFIHCADLHLGAPFRGVGLVNQELATRLVRAAFGAFDSIVDRAISEKVDFVLIAGDVFDSEDRSLAARLSFRQALQRLDDVGIKSFIVCGNHDPLQSWSRTIALPESALLFGSDAPQNIIVGLGEERAVEICGMSYAQRVVTENLAIGFSRRNRDLPGIALLHANIGGAVDYKPYAPATLADIRKLGFDYWALGHVHEFSLLCDNAPAVVYPGCPQAASPRERGEKGACLVDLSLERDVPPEVTFFPADSIRYVAHELTIDGMNSFDELFNAIGEFAKDAVAANSGRGIILRLDLSGHCGFDAELRRAEENRELIEAVQRQFDDMRLDIWLERLNLRIRRDFDIDTLAERGGFVADVVSIADAAANDQNQLHKLCEVLAPLGSSCRELNSFTDDELQNIVAQARSVVLDRLLEDEEP